MKKHPRKPIPFYYKDIEQKVFCPACHRVVRTVVPATTVTYIVHADDDICVLDWEIVLDFGLQKGVTSG